MATGKNNEGEPQCPPRKRRRQEEVEGQQSEGGAGDNGSETGLSAAKGGDGDKKSNADNSKSEGGYDCQMELFQIFKEMTVLVDSYKNPQEAYFMNTTEDESDEKTGYKRVDTETYYKIGPVAGPPRQITMENMNSLTSAAMELFEMLVPPLEFNVSKWELDGAKGREYHNNIYKKSLKLKLQPDDLLMLHIFKLGRFCQGFSLGMNNGAGKAVLSAMVNMALAAYFGTEKFLEDQVVCFSVGGGSNKNEKFPLKETPAKCSRRYSKGSMTDAESLTSAQGLAAPSATSTHTQSSKSTVFVKLDKKGVVADVLAYSGCKPNWPHFLFVGEIKCASKETDIVFSDAARAQLKREMLPVLLNQSQIYGILMSDKSGYLCKMKLCLDKRVIYHSTASYPFATHGISCLKEMFLDLINALDDMSKVEKVIWPLKTPINELSV